jgi:hypothetical protein
LTSFWQVRAYEYADFDVDITPVGWREDRSIGPPKTRRSRRPEPRELGLAPAPSLSAAARTRQEAPLASLRADPLTEPDRQSRDRETRHTFQQATLVQLQDELQPLVRITARDILQRQRTMLDSGQRSPEPGRDEEDGGGGPV